MNQITEPKATSPQDALDLLSAGKPIRNAQINDMLNLDPLVMSRWLCGEDMRGIYLPIILCSCSLNGLNAEGRTFYEMFELTGCHISEARFNQAYFYSILLIEECIFEKEFDGKHIQSDGRVVIHNTVFTHWADFSHISWRGKVDLVGVSFPGGTNLLQVLNEQPQIRFEREIRISGCGFRREDVPPELRRRGLGIVPLAQSNPRHPKG